MSIPRDDADYLSTTVYKTGNTGIDMTQDIAVTLAVNMMAAYAASGIIYNLGGKQVLNAATKRLNVKVTQKMLNRLAEAATQKVTGTMTRQLSSMVTKNAAKYALRAMGKTAMSAGTKAGVAAAGGCTMGPVGCAAGTAIGVAIFIAEMTFSVVTVLQDIYDKKGITQLLKADFVEQIANEYKSAINVGYRELLDEDEDYEYTEEEVFFQPVLFLFDVDPEDGQIYMDYDNEWAQKFVEYQNEYLTNIGIEPGWELRILTGEIPKPDLSVGRLGEDKKKVVAVGLTISALFAICLIVLFLFLVIL